MDHAILRGWHEATLDRKNRMLVPAEIRHELLPERDGNCFFLTLGLDNRLWLYPEKTYHAMVMQYQHDLIPNEDELAFDRLHFSTTAKIEWDSQGRIVIPERYLRLTNTGKEVTLFGARDHVEIWNRDEWEDWFKKARSEFGAIALRARQSRLQP